MSGTIATPRGTLRNKNRSTLKADLEAILGTRVDLIPAADLKPGVREQVEPDLIAL
jgi:predicted nucleotidyltransferase